MNSTIKTKKKECIECHTMQFIFSKKKCRSCASKTYAPIKKVSDKRMIEEFAGDESRSKQKSTKGNAALQRWFEDRHKEMTGYCKHCGGATVKNKSNYKCSIAHILPKAYFPSVATNENNWIELCFYGNSCHTNHDNHMIDITELNCFDEVIEKFIKMYPKIDAKEKRRIPHALLQYLYSQ